MPLRLSVPASSWPPRQVGKRKDVTGVANRPDCEERISTGDPTFREVFLRRCHTLPPCLPAPSVWLEEGKLGSKIVRLRLPLTALILKVCIGHTTSSSGTRREGRPLDVASQVPAGPSPGSFLNTPLQTEQLRSADWLLLLIPASHPLTSAPLPWSSALGKLSLIRPGLCACGRAQPEHLFY